MSTQILFSARQGLWEDYKNPLKRALQNAGVSADLVREADPSTVDYIVFAPNGPVQDFSPFRRAKAALGLWAGVEDIVGNQTLKIPLARMVDPGLARGMAEWVSGHILRYHLGLDLDIRNDDHSWSPRVPPLARDQRVGILGFGELGKAVASALKGIGFNVTGWARSPRDVPGFDVLFGQDGFRKVLAKSDYLVLLLPLTPKTEMIIDSSALDLMKRGATLINPGRGGLLDDEALMVALDAEHVAAATLDVFRQEPLPQSHPFWQHPRITITPHIASATRPSTASEVIAENIRRGETGEPFLNLVDRNAGY